MQTRARVYTHYPTGSTPRQPHIPAVRHVKNLGWLLRHAHEIKVLSLHTELGEVRFTAEGTHANSSPKLDYTYVVTFGSKTVAERFAARRIFAHCAQVR